MKTVSSLTVSSHDFTAVVKEQLIRLQTFITDTLRDLETPIDTAGMTTQSSPLPSTSQSSPLPSTLPEDVAHITTQLSPLPSTLPEDVAHITTQLSPLPSTLPEDVAHITTQLSPLPSTLPEDVAHITTQLSSLPSTLPEDVAHITTQLSPLPSTLPEVSTAGVTSEKEIVKKRKPIKAAPLPTQGPSTPTSRPEEVTTLVVRNISSKHYLN
jgi:hypothetical protein